MALGIGALIAAGLLTSLGSGVANYFSQQSAQSFNAEQAELNRQFQERLSSTAYQRSVADMKASGLNTAMLMNQGSAASSPTGSAAYTSPMHYNFNDMFNSAVGYVLQKDKQAFTKVRDAFMQDSISSAKKYLLERKYTLQFNNFKKRTNFIEKLKNKPPFNDKDPNGGLQEI